MIWILLSGWTSAHTDQFVLPKKLLQAPSKSPLEMAIQAELFNYKKDSEQNGEGYPKDFPLSLQTLCEIGLSSYKQDIDKIDYYEDVPLVSFINSFMLPLFGDTLSTVECEKMCTAFKTYFGDIFKGLTPKDIDTADRINEYVEEHYEGFCKQVVEKIEYRRVAGFLAASEKVIVDAVHEMRAKNPEHLAVQTFFETIMKQDKKTEQNKQEKKKQERASSLSSFVFLRLL